MAFASRMSRFLIAVVLLSLAAPAFPSSKAGTHEIVGDVVSADVKAKTITIRVEEGEEKTLPVLPEALEALRAVKKGDAVTVTCRDDAEGKHEGVVAIHRDETDPARTEP